MWKLEWKKEKVEKEKKELLNKKNKEKEQAMYSAQGTGSSDMYEEDDEDIDLIAIEELEP